MLVFMLPTLIYRHSKERLSKCTLHGLEGREDLRFYTYPREKLPSLDGYLLLTLEEAPLLSQQDASRGLLLIDGSWAKAAKMARLLPPLEKRSLPKHILTAYPRRQTACLEPTRGLASVEALYIAFLLLGREVDGLLDLYHTRDAFLQKNNLT
jgi:pre-rRNA-processing protein TSR3